MKPFSALASIAACCTISSLAATTADQALEVCRDRLKKAKQLDLLYDLSWEKGKGPRVLVGPTYHRITIDAKEGFAKTVNCFLVSGSSSQCMNFDLRDSISGKIVGRFKNCRLIVDN